MLDRRGMGASDPLPVEFEDRGEHELKGVPGTHRLYAVED